MEDSSSSNEDSKKRRRRSRSSSSDPSSTGSRRSSKSGKSSRSRSGSDSSKRPASGRSRSGSGTSSRSGGKKPGKGSDKHSSEISSVSHGESEIQSHQPAKEESKLAQLFLWVGRLIVLLMVLLSPWLATNLSEGGWAFTSLSQTSQFWLTFAAIAGIVMWWFSMAFGNRGSQLFPYIAFPVILGLILVGFQLIPMGQGIAGAIAPKQAELMEKFGSPVAGELLQDPNNDAEQKVRVTMDTDATAKMFNLLMLTLICTMLGCHFFSSRKAIFLLPVVLTVNGVMISIYGMIQTLGKNPTIYNIQGMNSPFGPFVNRNNASGYLLMCLAAGLALAYGVFKVNASTDHRPRQIITKEYPIWKRAWLHLGLFFAELTATRILSLLACLVMVIGILLTYSRGGILAMSVGMTVAATYYSLIHKSSGLVLVIGSLVLLIVGVMTFFGVTEQLAKRIGSLSDVNLLNSESRVSHWIQTAPAISDFSPLGSGLGSYLNVHRLYRVDNETVVYYFAENQYFQSLVELGIPGLLLLLSAIVIMVFCVRFIVIQGKSPKTSALSFMGMFLLPSMVIASMFDFGLFIPCNAIAMACLCGFIAGQAHTLADRLKKASSFRFRIPQFVAMASLLAMFTASLFSLILCHRYSKIEQAMGNSPQQESFISQDLETTNKRIEELKTRLEVQQDSAGLVRLSELYVFRYRLKLLDALVDEKVLLDTINADTLERSWMSTSLDRLHSMIYQAWRSNNRGRVDALITDPLVLENLLPATYYLKLARVRSPLQPAVHLQLAQLHAASPIRNTDRFHLDRSQELAPANAPTAFICGILDLQANRLKSACVNLNKCLLIDRTHYSRVVRVSLPFLPAERIAAHILPEDPLLLFNFAKNYMGSKSMEPAKLKLYQRVADLLEEGQQWDQKSLTAKAEVQVVLGNVAGAIKTYMLSIDLNPSQLNFRYRLAQLYAKNDRLDEAIAIARYLALNSEADAYKKFYQRLRKLQEEKFDLPRQ